MANFNYKTRGNSNPQGKPRVCFCCHPEDFNRYFESISDEILAKQNCAVWYTDEVVACDDDFFLDLKQMQLFVMPVTTNLLCTENQAIDIEFKFAIENHIPVLPLMQESGLEELFNKKCGDLQFLDKNNTDETAISYDDKLKKYLEAVLIGDELAEKIRAAFDAYVFLSYRKKDRRYAQELMRLIHKNEFCRDIAIWYDEFLTPGENFNDSIKEALQKSGLFVLTVTPNLINEQNYIMTTEYPMAKREGKPILPAELVPTDREILVEKYEDIPNPADAYNDAELSKALFDSIKIMNIKENDISPEHNFFIGLAYLGGVDVEVDRKRALELITMAANDNLPEAMAKLISMYSDGVCVERDTNEVQKWSKRLAEYYFSRIISKKGKIKSKNKICELFSHYEDEHWNETIKCFLMLVDERLVVEVINELFSLLMQLNFCEYTLFFEACKGMLQHKEVAQRALLMDIMQKSINGVYPPYGPLFWYVPKYGLYEQLLMILNDIEEKSYFTKALALTRDVCWIFGRYNTSYEITNRIDGNDLFAHAELCGVRRSLCELFFTETVTEECGDDVYPRCFNIAEAKHWKEQKQGVYGRMPQAFEDELGLYTHEMFSELGGEYIGIVAAPYDRERLETILSKKSCRKLCGLFFSPTGEQDCEILNINTNHLKAVYVPENTLNVSLYWKRKQGIYISEKGLFYFYDTVCLPNDLIEIGDRLFGGYSYIISIVIPDSVMEIGNHAFEYCRSLESITIPNSVKTIGEAAFQGCISLEAIFIPNNVSIIGGGAFSDCCALSSVIIPNGVNKIGPWAFSGCSSIASFVIPDGVTKIEDSVFRDCSALFSIKIPNSVTEIGARAFERCTSLTSISIPDRVSVIGTGAFEGCSSLESITLPNAVTELGWKVFQGCTSLKRICNCPTGYTIEELGILEDCIIETYPSKESKLLINTTDNLTAVNKGDIPNHAILRSVILNDGMISIGNNAFENFRNLISISMPNSVTEIGEYAFKGCCSLKSIIIPNQVRRIAPGTFEGCSSIRSIDLPKSIMEIGSFAFQGCAALESIEILGTTTKIGDCTFEYCRVLSSIVIPKGVMEIGYSAFRGCEALKSVVIPDEVISIGNSAFEDCKSLNSIIISDNITKIAYGVFRGCVSLKTVTLPCRLLEIGDGAFAGCETIDSIIIPNTVSKIGINAFGNCIALTSIILPDNLVEIGNLAFQGCYSLTSIRIPDGVTKIGKSIFLNCLSLKQIFNCPPGYDLEYLGVLNDCAITTRPLRKDEEELILQDGVIEVTGNEIVNRCALRSVTIADSVIKIGWSAFSNCGALESIVIPSNVIEIEAFAFWNCATLKSIVISNGVTRIGNYAFADCSLLTTSNIPAELTKIEDGVFQNCRSLVSIKIPNSVKTIGKTAFQGCISLSSIIIPASVKHIEDYAFAGCTGLKEITIPIRFEDDIKYIFDGVDLSQVTIHWI